MHLFNNGRETFLSYLRNLPSNSIILSFVFISFQKLEPRLFSQATLTFVVFLAMSIAAIIANSTLFMENYLSSCNKSVKDEALRLTEKGVKGFRHMFILLSFTLRNKPSLFAEALIVAGVVQYGLVMVILIATKSYTAYFKA